MLLQFVTGGLNTPCVTPLGEDSWKLMPGVLQTLLNAPFSFIDPALYPFATYKTYPGV